MNASSNDSGGSGSGSIDAVKEYGITITDPLTRKNVTFYEPVTNETAINSGRSLKCYFAPLCALYKIEEPVELDEYFQYSAKLLHSHPTMKTAISDQLASQYGTAPSETPIRVVVSPMYYTKARYSVIGFPTCEIDPKEGSEFAFQEKERLLIRVPKNVNNRFKTQVDNKNIDIYVFLAYEGRNVSTIKLVFNENDIKRTKNYRDLMSGGAAFVDAKQVQGLVTEIISNKNYTVIQDSNLPREITRRAEEIFDKLLNQSSTIEINDRETARKLEEKILEGTDLEERNFTPIVTMWDVAETLKESEDYHNANQQLRTYFNKDTNRNKISGSAGVRLFGLFRLGAGAGKEMTKENVQSGYFGSQDEFNKFKQQYYSESGQTPRITARGLKVIEKSSFESNLSSVSSYVTIVPQQTFNEYQILAGWIEEDSPYYLPQGLPRDAQNNWKRCKVCASLVFGGIPGKCPGNNGGPHSHYNDSEYILPHNHPQITGCQDNWRFCEICGCLVYGANETSGCSYDGHHTLGATNYQLGHNIGAVRLAGEFPHGETEWRFCVKCGRIVFRVNSGACTASSTGKHETGQTNYTIPKQY